MRRRVSPWQLVTILLILPLLLLTFSDYALKITQSSKKPMRGIENNRLGVSFFPNQSRDCLIIVGRYQADRSRYKSLAREFRQQGISLFLFDFSGHGRSWGKTFPKKKAILPQAKELSLIEEQILASHLFTKENLYYLGDESGSTVLIEAASRGWIHPKALILFDTYTVSQEMAEEEWLTGPVWLHETIKSPPFAIKEIPSTSTFFRSYDLMKRKPIQAILNEVESVRLTLNSPQVSFYPTARLFALFCFFWALCINPFLYLLFHLVHRERQNQKSVTVNIEIFTRKDLCKSLILFSLWIPAHFLAIGSFFLFQKSTLAIPPFALFTSLLIGFFGMTKMLFLALAPKRWDFKRIFAVQKAFHKTLSNKEQELEAFRSGVIYAFAFLVLHLLASRLALFYVIPRNGRQIWLPLLSIFIFSGFYIAALESYDAKKSTLRSLFDTFLRWIPLWITPFLFFSIEDHLFSLVLLSSLLLMGRLMLQKEVKPLQIAFFQSLIFIIITLSQGAMIASSY